MNAPHDPTAAVRLRERVRLLEAVYRDIAGTRMQGVPVLHAALQVQAVGFELQPLPAPAEPAPGDPAVGAVPPLPWAVGILVTPWFMNLLRLPLAPLEGAQAVAAGWLAPGAKAWRPAGPHEFEFIGALEIDSRAGRLGVFEASSLCSPMFQFADHAAAIATAQEVLRLLRQPAEEPTETARVESQPATPATAPAQRASDAAPGRRGFLFGRGDRSGAAR